MGRETGLATIHSTAESDTIKQLIHTRNYIRGSLRNKITYQCSVFKTILLFTCLSGMLGSKKSKQIYGT